MKNKHPLVFISNNILKYNLKMHCCSIEGAGIQLEWNNSSKKEDDYEERYLEIEIENSNMGAIRLD